MFYIQSCEREEINPFFIILLYIQTQIMFACCSNYPTENFQFRKDENKELSCTEYRSSEQH